MARGDVFSLDVAVAAPGISAFTYGANHALVSHDAHVSTIRGLGLAKPWGQDAIGAAFEKYYVDVVPDVVGVWHHVSHGLVEFAEGLARAQDLAWSANEDATRLWDTR